MTPSVCVAVNVKNEAPVIGRLLDSVGEWASCICVIDTGSADGTIEAVSGACEPLGFGDRFHNLFVDERPWINWAHNYSDLLTFSREWSRCDYTWVLDADEVVVGRPGWDGEPDALMVDRIHAGDWDVWGKRILRNSRDWRFEGERHAFPVVTGSHVYRYLTTCHVENHRDGASGTAPKEEQQARFMRDAEHFAAKLLANGQDSRSAYYLAQSLHDAGCPEALAAYERRAAMVGVGNEEETQVARLMVARYLRAFRAPLADVVAAYERAIAHDPDRVDGLVELMRLHNDCGNFEAAIEWSRAARRAVRSYEPGGFLTRRSARLWGADFEEWRALVGLRRPNAFVVAGELLSNPHLPAPERRYVEQTSQAAA